MEMSKRVNSATVITKRHPEKAKNKPIIHGKVSNKDTKLFLDSGAEVNIIDCKYMQEHLGIPFSEVKKSKANVKCANNISLIIIGEICLNVTVANYSEKVTFLVAQKCF